MNLKISEVSTELTTKDGAIASLWKLSGPSSNSDTPRVLLTHGTFSNRQICLGVARHLVNKGFDCWILEWRGHGSSPVANSAYDFETIAEYDLQSAVHHVSIRGKGPLFFLGHSGGGILLTLLLCRHPELRELFKGMAIVACQAFDSSKVRWNGLKIFFSSMICQTLGYVPGRVLGLGPHDEKLDVMKQWFQWNLRGKFLGKDGFDYREQMKNITVPVLAISGAGDTLIAPMVGCKSFADAFGSSQKKFVHCGRETGFAEDYTHSRLLFSRSASREVYPLIQEWFSRLT